MRDLLQILDERQGHKIVICGPPGSGKMTAAIEVAAEACGMALSVEENQFAKAEPFAANLKYCNPSVLRRSAGDVSSVPALTVITQFEAIVPNERRSALKAATQFEPVTMVIPVNSIWREQVPSAMRLVYHEGFSQRAVKEALSKIPGFQWLPRNLKEKVLFVDGVAAGDLRRAQTAAKLLIHARALGEAIDADVDTAAHQNQNCVKFMNMQTGHGLAPHQLEEAYNWIQANVSSCLDLDDAADCAGELAQLQCTRVPETLGETLHALGAKYQRDGVDFPVQRPRWEDWRELRCRRPTELLSEQLHELRRTSRDIGKQAHITHGNSMEGIRADAVQALRDFERQLKGVCEGGDRFCISVRRGILPSPEDSCLHRRVQGRPSEMRGARQHHLLVAAAAGG